MRVELLIIDPQYDFCNPAGSLFVKGADEDMDRAGQMISRLIDKIDDIHVTLDSHHLIDVVHPLWYRDSAGTSPDPFTIITAQDIEDGKWIPKFYKRTLQYVKDLESNARYPLCIWPPHCLIGTKGATVVDSIMNPLKNWIAKRGAMVDFITKGSNIYTEHYSGVKAEVPDPSDSSTQINTDLIKTLEQADIIGLLGEAGSHCLANTVRDIVNEFGDPSYVKKMHLITDATSPVTGFESLQDDFVSEMTGKGMNIVSSTDFLA